MPPPFVLVLGLALYCFGMFVAALHCRRRSRPDGMFFFIGAAMAGISGLIYAYAAQLTDPLEQQSSLSYATPQLTEITDVIVLIPAVIAVTLVYYAFKLSRRSANGRITRQ